MMNFKRVVGSLIVALSFGLSGGAYANPNGVTDVLAAGTTNFINSGFGPGIWEQVDAVNNAGGGLGGALAPTYSILASQTTTFSAPGFYSGSLYSAVISGDTHNPLGGLDFIYQVTVDAGSGISDGVHRLVVNGFANYLTNVGVIRTPTNPLLVGERNPTSVDRDPTGSTIGWNWLPNPQCGPTGCFATPGVLVQGKTSAMLIVYTNASIYGHTTVGILDGATSSTDAFAPIPEPETYAMMLAGLGLMGFVARRRKKNGNA